MANDTLIQNGRFTSDGTQKQLLFRQDIDWFWCYNYTQAATQQNPGVGVEFYWQRGLADDFAFVFAKENAVDTLDMAVIGSDGFTLVDSSEDPNGLIDATVTAVSNANPPVVTVTSTAFLRDGDIVRMKNVTGAQQLGGIDFSISVLNGTTFSIPYMAQIVAGTNGAFQVVKYNPIFYPRRRFISSITQAQQAVVELTVAHSYTVGQKVRFIVPAIYGMREMNNLIGTITAIEKTALINTVTVDIDSSGFTAFSFPLTANYPFTQAQMVPVGEAADEAYSNLLDDATLNSAYIALKLGAGTSSPAGSNGDVIYWTAGKADLVDNE